MNVDQVVAKYTVLQRIERHPVSKLQHSTGGGYSPNLERLTIGKRLKRNSNTPDTHIPVAQIVKETRNPDAAAERSAHQTAECDGCTVGFISVADTNDVTRTQEIFVREGQLHCEGATGRSRVGLQLGGPCIFCFNPEYQPAVASHGVDRDMPEDAKSAQVAFRFNYTCRVVPISRLEQELSSHNRSSRLEANGVGKTENEVRARLIFTEDAVGDYLDRVYRRFGTMSDLLRIQGEDSRPKGQKSREQENPSPVRHLILEIYDFRDRSQEEIGLHATRLEVALSKLPRLNKPPLQPCSLRTLNIAPKVVTNHRWPDCSCISFKTEINRPKSGCEELLRWFAANHCFAICGIFDRRYKGSCIQRHSVRTEPVAVPLQRHEGGAVHDIAERFVQQFDRPVATEVTQEHSVWLAPWIT